MDNILVDSKERQKALDPEQSFIIQAPAGSGKTELLIQRYLRLLSSVDEPEEIIAITFTRKAASEMRARILNYLGVLQQKTEVISNQVTHKLAESALKQDKRNNWNILENSSRLKIQTIDSLCVELTKKMPMLSNFGGQPDIQDDLNQLYKQAAIRVLDDLENKEDWSNAIAELVFHLDNNLPLIKNLLVNMLKKRDQWAVYIMQEPERNNMESSIARLVEEQLVFVRNSIPEALKKQLLELLNFSSFNKKINNDEVYNSIASFPEAKADELNYWCDISSLLLTKAGKWRSRFASSNGFPSLACNNFTKAELLQKKDMVKELILELEKIPSLKDSLINILALPKAKFTDDEWSIIKALCELLKMALVQLRVIFSEHNKMDFIGISEAAIEALGTYASPTDLALNLDYKLNHLLIDEFQDVSVNQYRLIENLINGWSLKDGRSLFLVGDPMQSIYRFREAEVGIFIKIFNEKYLGSVPLTPLKLMVNFRSQYGLVSWVNNSFKYIFPRQSNAVDGIVSFSETIAFNNEDVNGDNVNIYPLYDNSNNQEAEQVCNIILKIKESYPKDNIAILVRSRSHLAQIIIAMKKLKISFKAVEIEGLITRPVIQDLLMLTRAYLLLADRIAWVAILRAPWCGLELKSMYIICNNHKCKTIYECLQEESLIEKLDTSERQRAIRLRDIFSQAFANKQRMPISMAIESIWCQLGGPAVLEHISDIENSKSFFELLTTLEQGGTINDVDVLSENIEKLYAKPDSKADDSLQIMTIHKSKGLEFDHVILPGLGRKPGRTKDDLLVWLLKSYRDKRQDLILAPIAKTGDNKSLIYNYINKIDKSKQRFENMRLLYVGVTRAKKTLHLLGGIKLKNKLECKPLKDSLLEYLWVIVDKKYQQSITKNIEVEIDSKDININQENKRLIANWSLPDIKSEIASPLMADDIDSSNTLVEFKWARQTIMNIGSVVHNVIEWIANDPNNWSIERINKEKQLFKTILQQFSFTAKELDSALQYVISALENMLKDERGKWILSDKHLDRNNEYAISGVINGKITNSIIDRTFVDKKGIRWIIDYKVSRHDGVGLSTFLDREKERYKDQLEKYALLMTNLGEKNIRLGLYFPLLQGWREWKY